MSQHLLESTRFGAALLRAMAEAERMAPSRLARLGNYVLVTVTRVP